MPRLQLAQSDGPLSSVVTVEQQGALKLSVAPRASEETRASRLSDTYASRAPDVVERSAAWS
jgi:hypothetical protein